MTRPLLELRYTTAPANYDGFGTVDHGWIGETNSKPVRLVAIYPEHLQWQETRYPSGMHPSHTRESWDDLIQRGLAEWNPEQTSDPEPGHGLLNRQDLIEQLVSTFGPASVIETLAVELRTKADILDKEPLERDARACRHLADALDHLQPLARQIQN